MGALPADRVTQTRPFSKVGLDYCGPMYIKERRHRNQRKIKIYVAIFICLTTKAVHIELVSDLTTEAFIAALKRFIARRGRCRTIYCDNATNFKGARYEYIEITNLLKSPNYRERTAHFLADEGIEWHQIPPRTPHFGGLWEAAVRSFKHHMKRVVGETLFTYEDLNTYVIEIEAILNSRPLTPISTDPNDTMALTPGHCLIGDTLRSLPERDLTTTPSNRLSSWLHIQKLKQHFWTRWYKEYLNHLIVRQKWHTPGAKIEKDTLVILKEDNQPPLHWPLGRVIELHPGDDGVVRVATVKTATGLYRRCVKKLAPLYPEEEPPEGL
ncbi:PREDICTED: uncharacterized protein LOC108550040 [Eufriesea mexicana]|uniref:uncharacterized protein LOC108550040 n=1 Tax=Eufriesea mexicana TaxID=516756 RepID=UPI00083BC29C|nr:PREDICTED: uncharacterized protein LOC108550040 [Eufriesea mexicana]